MSVGAILAPPDGLTLRVPVLHVHSVDDPRALYEGGLGPPFPMTRRRVEHVSAPAVIEGWQRDAGCDASEAPDESREWSDGEGVHRAEHWVWRCPDGMRLEHWKLFGAGHGWPGSRESRSYSGSGPETQVIDASREAWRFFDATSG